jgi:hypothetical protein
MRRKTADVTGCTYVLRRLIADIHGKKRGAILLFCPGHHTRLADTCLKYLRENDERKALKNISNMLGKPI